jgi:hypothetical protein
MTEETQDEHAVRAALNQSLFRQVNEQVKDVNRPFSESIAPPDWVCECADTACIEKISLTIEEYEALRSVSTHFAVAPSPGHVLFEVENVVRQTDRYWIVEKIGTAAAVASKERSDDLHQSSREERELEQAVD